MGDFLQDLRFSIRMLVKQPGFTAVAVLTLALGIGANTAIFSVVNAVLLRPLPYEEPDKLVMIWNRYGTSKTSQAHSSVPDFIDRRDQSRSLEQIAAIGEQSVNLIENDEPERLQAARVSGNLFSLLGVKAYKGRVFLMEEDRPDHNRVAIIGHGLWQRRFGGAENFIGKEINLNGVPFTVVGIMPEGFAFPDPKTELWAPIAFTPEQMSDDERGNEYLLNVGRIKQGVSFAEAQTEMETIAALVPERVPDRRDFLLKNGWGATVVTLQDQLIGDFQLALLVLLGAVAFVLLIACANVANLLLARCSAREKEMAIRSALGARRGRLTRQLIAESLLLAVIGGAVGLLVASWGIDLLPTLAPGDLPRMNEVSMDGKVLGFTLLISLVTGLIFGLAPAWRFSKIDLQGSLKEGDRQSTGASRQRIGSLLVVSEIALALILLVGAGLMIKSFQRLIEVDPGFETENRLTIGVSLPRSKYNERSQRVAFFQELQQRVAALPGVKAAGAAVSLPITGVNSTATFTIENYQPAPGEPTPGFEYREITPDYIRAMGIPLLKGRDFNLQDADGAARVALVDETLANRYWPNQNPLGKRIGFGSSSNQINWREVVGVVGHVKNISLDVEGGGQLYLPHAQAPTSTMFMVINTEGDPSNLVGAVRSQVQAMDRDLPVYSASTMEQILSISVVQPRFNTLLLGVFASVALALAMVGVYGIISYSVNQRTREIGVRMALGAQASDVLKLVLKRGLVLTFTGIAAGIAASLALTRLLSSLLFEVSATDPTTFIGVSVILAVIALLACYIPARRATKVDPIEALRCE